MKLSRPNVFVSQSPNQSKMKTEKVRSITKINRAMPRNENGNNLIPNTSSCKLSHSFKYNIL